MFQALHKSSKIKVAIKERLTEKEKFKQLWEEEIKTLKYIEKQVPGFVTSRLICTLDDNTKNLKDKYIIMEWIEGKNLEQFKSGRSSCKFDEEIDFIRMALILSQQLRYLHLKSIIHGDIKTKNIMLVEKCDFF